MLSSSGVVSVTTINEVVTECVGLRIRMIARSITRAYDEALRPIGLKITQFTLMVVIKRGAPESISQLADILAMERTTLTRNLQLLERDGLVELGPEGYRRARMIKLTPLGETKLEEALPIWRSTQNRVVESLACDDWKQTKTILELAGTIKELET